MARAAPPAHKVNLPSQDLATALRLLAAQEHAELLFDASHMAGRRSGPVRAASGPAEALRQMLEGTGYIAKRGGFGEILIVPGPASSPAPSGEGGENTAVAELLVVGSRTLNTAIRRNEDDIQPYAVFSSEVLAASQSETVEDFLRTRLAQDAQAGTLAQAPVANGGAARSRIDLGGLGPAQTLVLVDGRRLPSIPSQDVFLQSDINGIPLAAIDRIETLTATAGGIYGPGATGGVINVVLKRDYDGGQIGVSGGVTALGDAPHWRVDGAWGRTFFGGSTQVMLAFSHAEDSGLLQGQRQITAAARHQLDEEQSFSNLAISSSLNVVPLGVLPGQDPDGPGGPTYKPLNLALAAGGLAALYANAGAVDISLSPDGRGALQSLLSRTRSSAAMLSVRQVINPDIDAFLDVLYFRNTGWARGPRTAPTLVTLYPGEGGNPYDGPAEVSFPTPGLSATASDRATTFRVATGAILRLGRGWSAELDLSYGRASDTQRSPVLAPVTRDNVADIDLFDTGAQIKSLWPSFQDDTVQRQVNNLVDVNLRLSGPVVALPAGEATVTVLGEYRREHQPNAYAPFTDYDTNAVTLYPIGSQTQSVGSAYAELRAPLFDRDAAMPVRGLELQLAGRVDGQTSTAPADFFTYTDEHQQSGAPFSGSTRTFAFTAGVRLFPVDGLLLRASIATGYLPPTPGQLIEGQQGATAGFIGYGQDPLRGNEQVGSTAAFTFQWHGRTDLQPEHARTVSAGLVATPSWAPGLRVALDYTRIDKSREITDFDDVDFQFFLDHEAQYPGRVIRAPLSAADAAAGYVVGPVIDIDTTPLNIGRSIIQTVNIDASYEQPTRIGRFRLYARAVWEPDFRRKDNPDYGFYQTAGHIGGPLTIRGNGGVDWSRGRWRAGLNVQVYGAYDVTYTQHTPALVIQSYFNRRAQGGARVPPQAYLDLEVSYEQPLSGAVAGLTSVEYRFGLHNLFDTRPPLLLIDSTATQPVEALYYSPYGDPRGRRIEASVVGRF